MKTGMDKLMGGRIREGRGRHSQDEIAKLVGVSRAAVSQWESGDTKNLKPANLFKLGRVLGKSAEWLALGRGPETPVEHVPAKSGLTAVKPTHYPAASLAAKGLTYVAAEMDEPSITIPVFDVAASCGRGSLQPEHDTIVDFMRLSSAWARRHLVFTTPANLAVITAYGDSMRPTFDDGDILLVDTGVTEMRLDAIYAMECQGDLFIKRIQRRMGSGHIMVSDNPNYRDQEIDARHIKVLGRVIWAWNGKKL